MESVLASAVAGSPPIHHDGFGARWLAFDPESGDPVEVLSFTPELVAAPDFDAAVGERVARLSRVRHTLYARARRLDRPARDALHLFSDHMPGWRLSEMLRVAERETLTFDISAILALLRQLIPAVALFSRHQRDAAIGTIGVERLIVTPQARLVLAEYVLAPGLEKLQLSRERLWREFRVVLPHAASPSRIPPSADVIGMGVVAVSLLLGRLLKDDEYLMSLGELFESLTESSNGTAREVSAGFRNWIARALQFDEHTGFQSPHEAQLAFEEMLARERAYVTTPAQLELFVGRFEKLVGPPAEPIAATPAPTAVPDAPVTRPSTPPLDTAAVAAAVSVDEALPIATVLKAPEAGPLHTGYGTKRRMIAALIGLAALVLIEATAIAWLLMRDVQPSLVSQGELFVQSRPMAARVTIDGEERGLTPFSTPLPPGAHILEVRVGRSEPPVIPIQTRAGVQSGIYVELQSVSTVGAIDVRSEPPKARVTIDGQYRGLTPLVLRDLPPGDHEVLLEAGGRQVRQVVRVEPGITSQLVVPLGR